MPVPSTKNPAPRVLLRDVVFDRLLEAIVKGDLAPGEILKDNELEAWAGVSRTPVREAIDKLGSLGFIDVQPQKETRVALLDPPRFADRLETLQAVCVGVFADAVPLLEDDDIVDATDLISALRRPHGRFASIPVAISDLLSLYLRVYGNTAALSVRDGLMPHLRREINAREDDATYYMSDEELDALDAATRHRDAAAVVDVIDGYFTRLVTYVRGNVVAGKA